MRWVVAYRPETLRAIGDLTADWLEDCLRNAESGLLIPESKGLLRAWRAGLDPFFRGAPHLVLAVTPADWKWGEVDAAIALTYLELAALSHNIGACWAGYVSTAARRYKPLAEYLSVSRAERVRGGQMLGRIAIRPTASAPRAPLPENWL